MRPRPLGAIGAVVVVLVSIAAVMLALRHGPGFLRMDFGPVVVLLLAGAMIAGLVWSGRAARNGAIMAGPHDGFAPGWAFWGWFLPGLNLFVPFMALSRAWHVGGMAVQPSAERPPWYFWAWWPVFAAAIGLGGFVAARVTQHRFNAAYHGNPADTAALFDGHYAMVVLVRDILLIVAGVLFVPVVLRLSRLHDERIAATTDSFSPVTEVGGRPG